MGLMVLMWASNDVIALVYKVHVQIVYPRLFTHVLRLSGVSLMSIISSQLRVWVTLYLHRQVYLYLLQLNNFTESSLQ